MLTAYATPFDPAHEDAREQLPMQMNFDRFTERASSCSGPANCATGAR
ncbi:MAG: hypothetical protein R2708_05165 [Vicinamibacterales bacterium]